MSETARRRNRTRRRLSGVLNLLLLLTIACLITAMRSKGALPGPEAIHPDALYEPEQSRTTRRNHNFTYRGHTYGIHPRAEYEISGVVVSHNNISGIGDIYHTSDSVDLRDLCIVWGANLETGSYRKPVYWSEPWSCHVEFPDRESSREFDLEQFSNNHLLAMDEDVREQIRGVRIGDQITLQGYLIDYFPVEASERLRRTSLRRDDEGDGACEVLMVEKVNTLRQATPQWYQAWEMGLLVLGALLVLRALTWVALPLLEFRDIGKD